MVALLRHRHAAQGLLLPPRGIEQAKIIETVLALPALEYHVSYRQDGLHSVAEIIADGAVRTTVFRPT